MIGERGDQSHDGSGRAKRHGDEIREGKLRQRRETIYAPADLTENAVVAKLVERSWMNTALEGVLRTQHTAASAKDTESLVYRARLHVDK